MSDTIAALATAPVPSAIGILRLSGDDAVAIASAVFRPAGGGDLAERENHRLVYGTLLGSNGRPIDRVLATFSRAPHSYTGEDTAEFQCHGSPTVLSLGLEALFAAGARQAGPGEFTRRAFLNGKLDLTQAEAVADLISAETPAAVYQAAGQLSGALSRRVQAIYSGLVDVLAHFHAVLDYPDEDLDPFRSETIDAALSTALAELDGLLASYRRGRYVAGGVPCAIVGRPNAGKSSLLNALLGYERAIVTNIPGTTRDTVEERCALGGVLLRLIDTAGMRDCADAVEQLGVARSRAALEGAELALVLIDASGPITQEDLEITQLALRCAPHVLLVFTKADLIAGHTPDPSRLHPDLPPAVAVSALTGQGLDSLEELVAQHFPTGGAGEGERLSNARQAEAATRARSAVLRACEALAAGMTPDAVLTDAEDALSALGELTGKTLRQDITARIFERFCVGK